MSPHSKWLSRISFLAGSSTTILAVAVLVGWHIGYLPLIQVLPAVAAPMQRLTAFSFLISGLSLILLTTGRRRWAATLQLLVFTIAILVISEYLFRIDIGIDLLLGPAYITTHTSNAGRPSPVTALCFAMMSAALLLMRNDALARRTPAVRGIVGSVIAVVGAVSFLGYLGGHSEAYGWSHFSRVAAHTGIGFALLGLGVVTLAWQEHCEPGLPQWIPVSVTLAVAAGVLGLWQALIPHTDAHYSHLSSGVLIGGFTVAMLLGVTIYLAQQAWERNRDLLIYRMAFENSFDGLLLTRLDGSIQKANPSACAIFGRSEEEICHAGRRGLMDTTDPRLQQILEDRKRHGVAYGEVNCRRKDGSLFPIEVSSVVFEDASGEPRTTLALRDISERKRAEQQLREQAILLHRAHDAIIVRDLQAHAVFWNRGAETTYGFAAPEALGKITHELLKTRFPVPLKEIENIVTATGEWDGELVHATREGGELVVASRWSLLRDESGNPRNILEINRDITSRKKAEAELKVQTERLSLATHVASIGVWEWDVNTNQSVWDDTCYEIYGVPKDAPMAYDRWAQLVYPDDFAKVEASLQRAIRMKSQDYVEFRIVRPDGRLRHVSSAQGVVLDEQGNVSKMVGINIDVTERQHMQAQLEASARLSALGMMAGGVAHEINNPLTIIHASASDLLELAQDRPVLASEEVIRSSRRIRQTAERIAKIVKSLRRISREGANDQLFPAQVGKIVEETLEICREKFRIHSVQLLVPDIDPALTLPCREVQIAQVLLNLLQNAYDAVVELPGEKWVRLEVTVQESSLLLSVIDSGPGVPETLKTKIMDPFFTTKEVGKGTGLGLTLSRTIVEEHGGTLELSEQAGHTCFRLSLPMSVPRSHYAVG